MIAEVVRAKEPLPVVADWHASGWQDLNEIALDHWYGERPPAHRPHSRVRIAWDAEALYWMFHVADRYVRATAAGHQNAVCRDSCVEFFFCPGTEPSAGYFNVEINCGGTVLFHWQPKPKQDVVSVSEPDLTKLDVAASLPPLVEPERTEPTDWTVACRLPLAVLRRYAPVVQPGPGTVWRANFYKCADACSHPHWLTWAPVGLSPAGFHRPDTFGALLFR